MLQTCQPWANTYTIVARDLVVLEERVGCHICVWSGGAEKQGKQWGVVVTLL